MSKTVTAKSITNSQISRLANEAVTGGDTAQLIICHVALGEEIDLDDYAVDAWELDACRRAAGMTQHDAVAECVRVINHAAAQAA